MLQTTTINGNSKKVLSSLLSAKQKDKRKWPFVNQLYLAGVGDRVCARTWIDFNAEMVAFLEAENVTPFEAVLPVQKNMLESDNLVTETWLSYRFNRYRFPKATLSQEITVDWPASVRRYVHTIPITEEIWDTIYQAKFYVYTKDDLKPALSNIFCEAHDGILEITATNGHVVYHREHPIDFQGTATFFIAKNAVTQMNKMLRNDTIVSLRISLNDKNVNNFTALQGKRAAVVGRVPDERFPDFRAVLPKEEAQEQYLVPADYFVHLSKKYPKADGLDFRHGKVRPYNAWECENGYETIPTSLEHDIDADVCVKRSYLGEVKRLHVDEVVWGVVNPITVTMFYGDNQTNEYFLLMPIRRKE